MTVERFLPMASAKYLMSPSACRCSPVIPPRASPGRDSMEHDTPVSFEYHPLLTGACRPAMTQPIPSMKVAEGEKSTVEQNPRSRRYEVEDIRSRIRSGEYGGPV